MIDFTDILLGSTLPLHPYLTDHSRLSVTLIVDGNTYGETPSVDGDLATGIWEINSSLSATCVKHSVTFAIVARKGSLSIRFASVKLSLGELHAQLEARPEGYHEFMIGDSSSSIQLIISCSIKVIMDIRFSLFGSHDNHPVGRASERTQSHHEQKKSEHASREDLEYAYAKVIQIPDQDKKAHELSFLGDAYYAYYHETRVKEDLDKAIIMYEEAMQFTGPFYPRLAEHMHRISLPLIHRFQQTGDMFDLERAISYLQATLNSRFRCLGNLTDLENAISNKREAVELIPDGHPSKPELLNNLGGALHTRFLRLGDLKNLEDAILSFQKAAQLVPDGHHDQSNLAAALISRFERLGSLTDLEDAISSLRQAVQLAPDVHPYKPNLLSNLATALRFRFRRLGSLTDREDAISGFQKAVQLTPDGHPDKPTWFNNLGSMLQSRFNRLGGLTDLDDAILNHQKAVELTSDGHLNKPGFLSNLGNSLGYRFVRLGGLADLEEAILNKRKAIEITPDGHLGKPGWLNNLGNVLQSRFSRLGGITDLHDAILNHRKAIELTPNGHPDKPVWMSNLGTSLGDRFVRLGALADLQDAILNHRKAVELMPDGHPSKSGLLSALGNSLAYRFVRLGGLTDLEDAISNTRQAVELTPNGHRDKPLWLSNLASVLEFRFNRLGGLADLEDAISNKRKAVELIPDGHSDKPNLLHRLGRALVTRFRCLGILSDLDSGLSILSTAANSKSGPAMHRFKAARTWAQVSELYSRSPLEAFGCAIDLLPQIAWLGLAVTDQHALLADVGGIVRDAVAAAIRYEEYETAVVWAEQGRSIVWQNLPGLRNPVDDLREAYPGLANRLRSIAEQLEGSKSNESLGDKGQPAPVEGFSQKYSKLALEWDNLVDEIRKIPASEGFLKAKIFSQLAAAAHEGPVVIINVNDARCDALVLIADDSVERHVSAVNILLERFSHEKSKKIFQCLTELLSSAGVRERSDRKTGRVQSQVDGETEFKAILRILWQDVVQPVIEGLAFQNESSRPPRIWWCATGLLAFLPIHAAGLYDTQEVGQKVSDYVVSSYTPTLTAILELSNPVVREDFQVLTVAQASAPGAQSIPQTEDEVRIVQRLTDGVRRVNLMRENATVERVREEMTKSNWIHLACHGQQNTTDPMKSGFLLHDRILELSEIVKMSLPKADFAFLSACQTARGDEKVAEESVHLAAGMFLSGCRGVIATTWSIRDNDAPKIAQEVYTRMFKDGKPNRKEAAYALHEAVKLLRESGAPCTAWVPFIHIGR